MTSQEQQLSKLLRELQREGIADPRVLGAIEKVPRALFVPPEYREHAYRNIPLPIGEDQTVSQPYVVALMTEALELRGDETVLEVGTGSGYQSAILAELAKRVLSIERIETLAEEARRRLQALGYSNIEVRVGDGCLGWPERAPFEAILVTASCPRVPQTLIDQLADGGRLVVPVGSLFTQSLYVYRREGNKTPTTNLGPVRFVPLIGDKAWKEHEVRAYRELF